MLLSQVVIVVRSSSVLVVSCSKVQVEVAGDGEGLNRREGQEALLKDGFSLAHCLVRFSAGSAVRRVILGRFC